MKIAKRVVCDGEIHCHPRDSRLRFFVLTYHTIVSKHLRKLYLRDLTQHLTWLSIPTMGNSCHKRPDGDCLRYGLRSNDRDEAGIVLLVLDGVADILEFNVILATG